MKLKNVAIGSIWDPVAVNICHKAGENAVIDLSFGGKISSSAGTPVNKKVLIKK